MDLLDDPSSPHDEIPDEDLPPLELFDRLAAHRVEGLKILARVRGHAARLLAEHGVDGANDRLPPDVSIDTYGTVRFLNAYEDDLRWKEVVAFVHDEIGDDLLHRLPPDTHIDAATGVVTIEDIEPWW